MGFLGKLVKAAVDVVLVPVDVVKDVATFGGLLTDQDKPYTLQRGDKVIKDLEHAGEDAGDGEWL
jgi:hypothetical protein